MDGYEEALRFRRNWINPDTYGEVTYVGNYCVITGTRAEEGDGDEYGHIPGDTEFVSVMYRVNQGAIMDGHSIVAMYDADIESLANYNHECLVDQASKMDLLELVYGE